VERLNYKRIFLLGVILILVGFTMKITLAHSLANFGIVLMVVGHLLFIVSMARRRKKKEGKR
jgi:hypothetical protein